MGYIYIRHIDELDEVHILYHRREGGHQSSQHHNMIMQSYLRERGCMGQRRLLELPLLAGPLLH